MNCDLSIERLFQKYHVYDIRSLIPNYGNELEEEVEIVRQEKLAKKIRPTFGTAMFQKQTNNIKKMFLYSVVGGRVSQEKISASGENNHLVRRKTDERQKNGEERLIGFAAMLALEAEESGRIQQQDNKTTSGNREIGYEISLSERLKELNNKKPKYDDEVKEILRTHSISNTIGLITCAKRKLISLSKKECEILHDNLISSKEIQTEKNKILRKKGSFVSCSRDSMFRRAIRWLYQKIHNISFDDMAIVDREILNKLNSSVISKFKNQIYKTGLDGRHEVLARLNKFTSEYLKSTMQFEIKDYGNGKQEVCPTTVKRYVKELIKLLEKNKYFEAYRLNCARGRPWCIRIRDAMKSYALMLIRQGKRFCKRMQYGIWGHNILSIFNKNINGNNNMSPNQNGRSFKKLREIFGMSKIRQKCREFDPPDDESVEFCPCN